MLFLTSCATNKPLGQIEHCELPELRGETWGDVAIYAVEAKANIKICNIRIDSANLARVKD